MLRALVDRDASVGQDVQQLSSSEVPATMPNLDYFNDLWGGFCEPQSGTTLVLNPPEREQPINQEDASANSENGRNWDIAYDDLGDLPVLDESSPQQNSVINEENTPEENPNDPSRRQPLENESGNLDLPAVSTTRNDSSEESNRVRPSLNMPDLNFDEEEVQKEQRESLYEENTLETNKSSSEQPKSSIGCPEEQANEMRKEDDLLLTSVVRESPKKSPAPQEKVNYLARPPNSVDSQSVPSVGTVSPVLSPIAEQPGCSNVTEPVPQNQEQLQNHQVNDADSKLNDIVLEFLTYKSKSDNLQTSQPIQQQHQQTSLPIVQYCTNYRQQHQQPLQPIQQNYQHCQQNVQALEHQNQQFSQAPQAIIGQYPLLHQQAPQPIQQQYQHVQQPIQQQYQHVQQPIQQQYQHVQQPIQQQYQHVQQPIQQQYQHVQQPIQQQYQHVQQPIQQQYQHVQQPIQLQYQQSLQPIQLQYQQSLQPMQQQYQQTSLPIVQCYANYKQRHQQPLQPIQQNYQHCQQTVQALEHQNQQFSQNHKAIGQYPLLHQPIPQVIEQKDTGCNQQASQAIGKENHQLPQPIQPAEQQNKVAEQELVTSEPTAAPTAEKAKVQRRRKISSNYLLGYNYTHLIVLAFINSVELALNMKQIHEFVRFHFPSYTKSKHWKNSVRHVLCGKREYFEKLPSAHQPNGKTLRNSLYKIVDKARNTLIADLKKHTNKRREEILKMMKNPHVLDALLEGACRGMENSPPPSGEVTIIVPQAAATSGCVIYLNPPGSNQTTPGVVYVNSQGPSTSATPMVQHNPQIAGQNYAYLPYQQNYN